MLTLHPGLHPVEAPRTARRHGSHGISGTARVSRCPLPRSRASESAASGRGRLRWNSSTAARADQGRATLVVASLRQAAFVDEDHACIPSSWRFLLSSVDFDTPNAPNASGRGGRTAAFKFYEIPDNL